MWIDLGNDLQDESRKSFEIEMGITRFISTQVRRNMYDICI